MTDEDVAATRGEGRAGRAVDRRDRLQRAAGRQRRRRLRPVLQRHRQPDPLVHPALPLDPVGTRRHPPPELDAWDFGYQAVNHDIARAVLRQIEGASGRGDAPRLPPLHHAGDDPHRAPRRLPPPLRPHPWSQPDGWRILPGGSARRSTADAGQRHHRLPHPQLRINFLRCCDECWSATSTTSAVVRHADGQTVAARYPLSIDAERLRRRPSRQRWPRPSARCPRAAPQAPDHPRRPRRPVEACCAASPPSTPSSPSIRSSARRSTSSRTCNLRGRTSPNTPSTWSDPGSVARRQPRTAPPTGCRST